MYSCFTSSPRLPRQRWCVNRDFPQTVPLGQGSWLGYVVVTLAFMLVHRPVDYAGAFVYGTKT